MIRKLRFGAGSDELFCRLGKIRRSFELPTDLGIHAFRAGNLDASLHFTAYISCDSLLIVGPAVYGLNRAIPNDLKALLPLFSSSVYATSICCTLAGAGANRDATRLYSTNFVQQ